MGENDIHEYYYVLVFDLCSSSEILEDLELNRKISKWINFWNSIDLFLSKNSDYILYKFLGDGYIILVNDDKKEIVLELCKKIYYEINKNIKKLLEEDVNIEIKRTGITIGVDYGELIKLSLNNKSEEYLGKAINIAVRLQSSLKEIEHANKLLVSKNVKNNILRNYKSDFFKATSRSLKNIESDKKFNCFEINLENDFNNYLN